MERGRIALDGPRDAVQQALKNQTRPAPGSIPNPVVSAVSTVGNV
jgi:hypothetical protein